MIRVAFYLVAALALTAGLHWLSEEPGTITVTWLGRIAEIRISEISVLGGVILLAALAFLVWLLWWLLSRLWRGPTALSQYLNRRRRQRGLDALSGGIIAVGAGDRIGAARYAAQARKALPHEPLTHLLRAQAAQIGGDRATARRLFEAMLAAPDTEQLGLRGLFLEAEREGEHEAARQYAERALRLNPRLGWAVEALFDLSCRTGDWQGALTTLDLAERQHLVDKAVARRRRAVLLTAQAQALEDEAPERALELALGAHRLARELTPAAAIAGRILASRGRTPAAARVLMRAWRRAPHPELAVAYAYARPGDSPRDRLDRVRQLARLTPGHPEALIAVATAAIEARAWDEARQVLKPLLDGGRLTVRVCALMARIEGEEHGDAGRVREWLARAVGAARDPAWIADGVAYEHWSPVSPTTGRLDAMRWETPEAGASERAAAAALAAKLEAMLGLGTTGETRIGPPVPVATTTLAGGPLSPSASATDHAEAPVRTVTAVPAELSPPAAPEPAPAATQPSSQPPEPSLGSEVAEASPPADDADAVVGDVTAVPQIPEVPEEPATPPPPTPRPRRPTQPTIFVPPRAPDDPGIEASDLDDIPGYPSKA